MLPSSTLPDQGRYIHVSVVNGHCTLICLVLLGFEIKFKDVTKDKIFIP